MKKIDYFNCFLFTVIGIISRVPIVEKFQSQWDGPDYSIALIRYSFNQETPSPPGYPLYIEIGRFFYLFFHDLHTAIVAIGVFGSVLGAIVFYIVGTKMYNRWVGVCATTIFFTGSTFYYFGLTTYPYILLPGTTTLLAYIVYRIYIKHKQEGYLFGFAAALCFCIRPQEVIQIGLIYLLGIVFLNNRERVKAFVVFIIITILCFLPIFYAIGFMQYFIISYHFAQYDITNATIYQRLEVMIKGFLLSFGVSGIYVLYYIWKWKFKNSRNILAKNHKIIIFYACWIIPGVFYNLFLRSEHAGYQMSYLSGLLLLISYAIWRLHRKNRKIFIIAIFVIAIFNLYWFFYNRDPNYTKPYRPTSFHYSDIRKNDLKVGSKVSFIQQKFTPSTSYLISTEVLWRPYSYYLKPYRLTALNALDNTQLPYSYARYDIANWNMATYERKQYVLTFPKDVKYVIFPDDDAYKWIINAQYRVYKLPGNSTVTVVTIKPNTKIIYNYHYVKFEY